MGRIDRIGSPNKTIKGINFWPAKDYENYLKLKTRVENRMAVMTLVGTELDEELTPQLKEMVKDNPLYSVQTEKMLQQLQLTWDDVEDNDEQLGLNNLSLEQFRQELFELFKKNEEYFKKMPNGIYTGFKFIPDRNHATMPDSIIAVLGYPKRPADIKNWIYSEIHLLHQPINDSTPSIHTLQNRQDILNFLRHHKDSPRFVPENIDKGNVEVLQNLQTAISDWLIAQATPMAERTVSDLFSGVLSPQAITPEQQKMEDKFKTENFDLITWFIVSK
jgi:hypothetical protein